jgi:hypothetical protein
VPDIAEHDPEEEREGEDAEQCRVRLFVVGRAIGVDDLLEGCCELV